MLAATPSLNTRIWPLEIVTVTSVSVPLPSASVTWSRSIEIWFAVFVNVKLPLRRWPKASRKTLVPLTANPASIATPSSVVCVPVVVLIRTSNVPPTLMPGMLTATVAPMCPNTPALVSSRTPFPFDTVTKSRWSVPIRSARFAIVIRVRVSAVNVLLGPSFVN